MRKLLAFSACVWLAVGIPAALAGSNHTPPVTTTSIGAQPVDSTLTALAGGTCQLDTVLYCSGADAVSSATLTGAGRALIDDVSAAAQRATLSAAQEGACGVGQWVTAVADDAAPTCSQPAFSDLSGSATDAQVPDNITVTLAATATALASNPSDCAADALANSIDAAGALTCIAVPDCDNGTTSKLLYDTTTHAFSCGTDQSGGSVDASSVTFTPTDNTDWSGSADPGNADDALNQLAQRVTDGAVNGATVTLTDGQTYTVAAGVGMVLANCSTGSSTVYLPAASTFTGKSFTIKLATGGTSYGISVNAITYGGTTIDGATGVFIYGPNASRTVWSDGTAYYTSAAHSMADSLVGAADAVPYYTGVGGLGSFTATQDGRALAGVSWSSGSQVPYLSAAGAAGLLTVGTGANNLVQLTGTSKLPAVDGSLLTGIAQGQIGTADSWDVSWDAAAGDPGTSGNYTGSPTVSLIGAGAFDGSAATFNGVSAWKYTPTSASARQGLQIALSQTFDTAFELRVRVYMPASPYVVGFALSNALDSQLLISPGTTALNYAGPTAIGPTPDITNQWVTMTVKGFTAPVAGSASGEGAYILQCWLGEVLVGTVQGAAMTNGVANDNMIRIERSSGTSVTPFYIANINWRAGTNSRPPSQTFAGLGLDR